MRRRGLNVLRTGRCVPTLNPPGTEDNTSCHQSCVPLCSTFLDVPLCVSFPYPRTRATHHGGDRSVKWALPTLAASHCSVTSKSKVCVNENIRNYM